VFFYIFISEILYLWGLYMEYTRKISWSGDVEGLDNPVSTVWGAYLPCWWPGETDEDFAYNNQKCGDPSTMYWEDFNIKSFASDNIDLGVQGLFLLTVTDAVHWASKGRVDVAQEVVLYVNQSHPNWDGEPGTARRGEPLLNSYTWGDVTLTLRLFNELRGALGGKAGRRGKLDTWSEENPEDKKKLIRLICRVKGEKVYDEKKEVGNIKIKLKDVDMVINEILGKLKVETKDVL